MPFGNNASAYDKGNFYFSLGPDFGKHWNAEIFCQHTITYARNRHTYYTGATYKKKIRPLILYYRVRLQQVCKYFTGEYDVDDAYFEFRSRLRITFPVTRKMHLLLSAEPYLYLKRREMSAFSQIRNVLLANYNINRY